MFNQLKKIIQKLLNLEEKGGLKGYFFEFTLEELSKIAVVRSLLNSIKEAKTDYLHELDWQLKMIFDMELGETGYIPYWNVRKNKDGEFELNLFTGILFKRCAGASQTPIERMANGWWVGELPEYYLQTLEKLNNKTYF